MTLLKVIVARPILAIVLALVVVGVLFLSAERQSTPVTHRNRLVALSDEEQMPLGAHRSGRARLAEPLGVRTRSQLPEIAPGGVPSG